jgi:hypothetical protein
MSLLIMIFATCLYQVLPTVLEKPGAEAAVSALLGVTLLVIAAIIRRRASIPGPRRHGEATARTVVQAERIPAVRLPQSAP